MRDNTWWTLRLTYGLVPIVAGADKFTNLLTDWTQYLAPAVERALPFSGAESRAPARLQPATSVV